DLPSDPAEDREFAAAIKSSRAPVVLAAATEDVADRQFRLTQQITPLPAFVAAGARVGFATIRPDVDSRLRRAELDVDGRPTRAAAALTAGGHPIDPAAVPTEARGDRREFRINFAGAGRTIRTVSYYQAVSPEPALPDGFFSGKTVFVGRSVTVQELSAGAP